MKSSGLILGLAIAPTLLYAEQTRPNVILIQTDDLGFDDLGIHGQNVVQTPNLDALGASSIQFKHYYVNQLSAPSRASLLTGRHFWRTGVSGVHAGRDIMNSDEKIIAEYLKEAGYTTAMWGKWHSGKCQSYFPWERGFDQAYKAKLYQHDRPNGMYNGKQVSFPGKWSDQVCSDFAIEFLKDHESSGEPFFAYLSYLAPHGPWQAPQEYIDKYLGMGLSEIYATLCGQIDYLDFQIGRVLSYLETSELYDNTIVVFVSDNGPVGHEGATRLTDEEWRRRNHNRAKGAKATAWDNGIHSPLFIKWGDRFEAGENNHLVTAYDIMPTLLDMCGATPSKFKKEIDGVSFYPIMEKMGTLTEEESSWREPVFLSWWTPIFELNICEELEGQAKVAWMQQYAPLSAEVRKNLVMEEQIFGLIDGNFKLLINHPGEDKICLKHLALDPREQKNFAEQYPQVTQRLYDKAVQWYQDIYENEDSFNMPTFRIGSVDVNSVFAFGPTYICDNLYNDDHCLQAWRKRGDMATYNIQVDEPGLYEVRVTSWLPGEYKKTAPFRVSIGKKSVETTMNAESGPTIKLSGRDKELKLELCEEIAKSVEVREIQLIKR
ncbi:MAG: sulfatase-like hydrolase/transferase [Rikenellaceae bacterium]